MIKISKKLLEKKLEDFRNAASICDLDYEDFRTGAITVDENDEPYDIEEEMRHAQEEKRDCEEIARIIEQLLERGEDMVVVE